MTRYRMTAWPEDGIQIPTVDTALRVRLTEDDKKLSWFQGEPRELEDEVSIRELPLLDLGPAFAPKGIGLGDDRAVPNRVAEFIGTFGTPFSSRIDRYFAHRVEQRAEVHQIVAQLSLVQTCARHFVAVRRGLSTADVWGLSTDDAAPIAFATTLSRLMKPFHPKLLIFQDSLELPANDFERPTIIGAMAAQIFNYWLDEEMAVKACPICGQDFLRQRGRAKQGQHRTVGVKFCSKSCGRASASRNYRRRKREESGK